MPQTQFDPNATYQPDAAVVAGFDPNATYQPAATTAAPGDDRSLLDRVANDPNTEPLDSYTHATARGLANIGQGGAQAVQGTISLLNPKPQDENEKKVAAINPLAVPVYRLLRGIGHSAGDAVRLAQAYHESGGPSLEELSDVAGTTAGNLVTGEVLGEGTGAAGRGVKAAIEAPAETLKTVATAPVRLAARTAEAAINQKLVPAKPLLRIMTPADEAESVHVKVPGRDLGLPPKAAPTPAAAPAAAPTIPTTAGEQASLPLVMGEQVGEEAEPAASPESASGPKSQPAPAAAQFDLPAQFDPNATYKPAEAEAAPKPAGTTPAKVESLLNDSLGGKPLEKNVPLRQQVPSTTAKSGAASSRELPEGFTPTQSSVLAGYKYNPATQEFESITNSGQHYVHGEVSPDQAADFEAADSKGKAWNKLRGSSVLVAKVLNGVRKPITGFSAVESGAAAGDLVPKKQAGMRSVEIDPETGRPEFSDVLAARKPAVAPAGVEGVKSPTVQSTPELVPVERYSDPGREQGYFYAPAGQATGEFGPVLSKAHIDASQLYKGTSSIDLAKEAGYIDKPIPKEAMAAIQEDLKDVPPEWIKAHDLPAKVKTLADLEQYHGFINGSSFYEAFQRAAADHLQAKGFKGAYWSEEDEMNPQQYQVWDRSAVHEPGAKPAAPAPKAAPGPASPKAASGSRSAVSGEEDLTPLLQQSLDQVNLDKGAVHTTATPAALSKRWGVDSDSLAAGREQTRGMSPEQTEQYIAKLVESYKKGTPVEPVMETRDAQNNIIAVDGRARAIAAGRAGIERIPIIVRRLKK